jgi:putative IMPACT (imprinted ancient) family translation regulator
VLRGAGLADVIAVVTRWYGGTKLGKGGLARAYANAVKEALSQLAVEERWPTVELRVELAYERLGPLKRLVHPPEVVIADEEYGSSVRVVLIVRRDRLAEVERSLSDLGAIVAALDGE